MGGNHIIDLEGNMVDADHLFTDHLVDFEDRLALARRLHFDGAAMMGRLAHGFKAKGF